MSQLIGGLKYRRLHREGSGCGSFTLCVGGFCNHGRCHHGQLRLDFQSKTKCGNARGQADRSLVPAGVQQDRGRLFHRFLTDFFERNLFLMWQKSVEICGLLRKRVQMKSPQVLIQLCCCGRPAELPLSASVSLLQSHTHTHTE